LAGILILLLGIPGMGQAAPLLDDPQPDNSITGNKRVELVSASSEEVIIDVRVDEFDTVEVNVEGQTFQRLSLPETGTTSEIGKPELPVLGQFVAIPAGADVNIEVVDIQQSMSSGYMIYPAQEPPFDQAGATEPPFTIDDAFYQQDVFYPTEYVEASIPQTMRDITVVWLSIHPLQFNPAKGELRFNNYMRLRLTFTGGIDNFVADGGDRADDAFENICQKLVINCNSVEQGIQSAGDDLAMMDAGNGAEYLIISPPEYVTAANTLADWKNERGISTVVKTTDDTGTTATSIKNYIQTAYNSWTPKPAYVLFLGDADDIPVHYVTVHPAASLYYSLNHKTGTDLYYATMGGSSDRLPDIHLGRIPVGSLPEANHVVSKIITYETNPPSDTGFYNRAAMGAYFQDHLINATGNSGTDGRADRLFTQTSEEIRDYLLTQGYNIQRIYTTESSVDPRWYNDGTALPGDLRKPGFAWDGDSTDINNAVDNGVFILNHRDHGSRGSWGDPNYTMSHIETLNNGTELPIVFSINCETGWFDAETDGYAPSSDPGFAEKFLRYGSSGQRGAVGVFAATRISLSWHNDTLVKGFYDSIWPGFLAYSGSNPSYRMGDVLSYGKYYYASVYGSSSTAAILTLELYHYLGDPTMEIWTAAPSNLNVSIGTAKVGEMSYNVDVDQNNGLISIVQNGQSLGTGVSTNGANTLSLNPAFTLGPSKVTVTKHNYRPYRGTVYASCSSDVNAPWYYNIESGTCNWTSSGLWHQVDDGSSPYPNSHSTTHSWWYGQDGTGNYDTGAQNYGHLTTPSISIPASAPAPELSFWQWYQTEAGRSGYDQRKIQISVNGGPFQDLGTLSDSVVSTEDFEAMQNWEPYTLDFSAYKGQTVQVRFYFDTIDEQNNNYRGWYIDDVQVSLDGSGIPASSSSYLPVILKSSN
jgi:hypothetical protein